MTRGVPSALREVITAGEQLQITPRVVQLFEHLPHCLLTNHYGPSESHVVSCYRLGKSPHTWPALPPIGRPIANTRLYVLDRHLQPVPVGVPGELYIGGTGLARGYHARPEWTAERFVPHPFSSVPGARLYKTGDMACYLHDGILQFLGRLDHQVKLRGFRIELGEIEAVLSRHAGVQDVIVLAREDAPGEKRLVAYVVRQQESTPATAVQLRQYLQGHLPDYMIPAHFVFLDQLPLTPNGKVNRRALPAPQESDFAREKSYEAPRTPVEEQVAAIWREVLRLERVGVYDDFFSSGGHSLLATQVVSRIREIFAVEVPLRLLFETPSVASLAEYLEQARQTTPEEIGEDTLHIPVQSRGESDVDQLLGMLEHLSEAEVRALLATDAGMENLERKATE